MNEIIDVNNIRNMAYRFLLKENISSLPVSAISILIHHQYYLRYYTRINGIDPDKLIDVYGNAFVKTMPPPYSYNIAVNRDCEETDANWAIMHSIACIELGLVGDDIMGIGSKGWDNATRLAAMEADLFTLFVMCPDIILKTLKLTNPNDIATMCNVPLKKAIIKSKYFSSFDYLIPIKTPTEQKILSNFREYISEYKQSKNTGEPLRKPGYSMG